MRAMNHETRPIKYGLLGYCGLPFFPYFWLMPLYEGRVWENQ
jgi:hypothetical protein